MDCDKREIEYVVMDPSKNITILVLSKVLKDQRESVSKRLLEIEKSAEQVGFLTYGDKCDITIEMAGGEFCGNATMSAAVYFAMDKGIESGTVKVLACGEPVNVEVKCIDDKGEGSHSSPVRSEGSHSSPVRSEGSHNSPVRCDLQNLPAHSVYEGIVEMPRAKEIKEVKFSSGETFTVVFFEGIAHIIFETNEQCDSELKRYLESNIKVWCEFLKVPAMGVMVCDKGSHSSTIRSDDFTSIDSCCEMSMIALVYVKSVDTLYWESSCASGTTAVGAYFTKVLNKSVTIDVWQTSGTKLTIKSNEDGRLQLKGQVEYLYTICKGN